MNKFIVKILELNKLYYEKKALDKDTYLTEFLSIFQSLILDFNSLVEYHNTELLSVLLDNINIIRDNKVKKVVNDNLLNLNSNSRLLNNELVSRYIDYDNEENNYNSLHYNISRIENFNLDEAKEQEEQEEQDNFNLDEEEEQEEQDNLDEEEEQEEQYNLDEEEVQEDEYGYYINSLEQCCARIGNNKYDIDEHQSEFIDMYPSDVYIDKNGIITGNPCTNIVEDFDEYNNFMCDEHKANFEDIRKCPKN